jgi:hypothetical protein
MHTFFVIVFPHLVPLFRADRGLSSAWLICITWGLAVHTVGIMATDSAIVEETIRTSNVGAEGVLMAVLLAFRGDLCRELLFR